MILSPVTVLVVEDEPLLCELMVDELRTLGFIVLRATTGEEALNLIAGDEPVDVLFTDIRLPGALDGWDVAEKFRSRNPSGPVIYTTGYTGTPVRRVSQSAFMPKPYRPGAIVSEIRRLSGPA
jgi:CheY-like chemotaxis protein